MKEPANINTTTIPPAPTAIVYGMPAYVDLAAAVDEVHARPHLLLQAPGSILQLAFMTEGDVAKDQMAISTLFHRFGVAEPDHATLFHDLTWDEGDLHREKHAEFSTYLWCASLDSETESRAAKTRSSMDCSRPGRLWHPFETSSMDAGNGEGGQSF